MDDLLASTWTAAGRCLREPLLAYRRKELQSRRPEEVVMMRRLIGGVQVLHLAQEVRLHVGLSSSLGVVVVVGCCCCCCLGYLKLPAGGRLQLPGGGPQRRRHHLVGGVSRDVVHVLLQLRWNHRCHSSPLPHDQHLCTRTCYYNVMIRTPVDGLHWQQFTSSGYIHIY